MSNSDDLNQTQSNSAAGNTTLRGRCFILTLNNPTNEELQKIRTHETQSKVRELVGQLERGEQGTLHAQFCIKYKSQRYFHNVKEDWPRAHIEKCRGKWEDNVSYCSKRETREGETWGFEPLIDPIPGEYRPWQQQIMDIIKEQPDDRTIHWVVNPIGKIGKSSLGKHICMHNDRALLVGGKAADVKYAISEMKRKPKIVIFDYPRCCEDYVSYQAIEEVKNGIFFNTKYESKMVLFNPPHVICFSNFYPDTTKMSEDRWNIIFVETPPEEGGSSD